MITERCIEHVESGQNVVARARWCDTFASKLRGFTWRWSLEAGEGLVLVEKQESRINTAIHMLFVFFDLGVLWVNNDGMVVDKVLARPWRLSYTPRVRARYVIEAEPSILELVNVGDHVRFMQTDGD
jgi:uncharacterized protein